MQAHPPVLAVCVNWNGREVLASTLAALRENGYPNLRVTVVDNASSDGSAEHLPADIQLIRLEENRGYGSALNAGIRPGLAPSDPRQGRPTYFLLLNNDVVLAPGSLARLVQFAQDTGPGIFGPKILQQQDPRRLEAAWGSLSWSHVLARFQGKDAPDGPRWSQPRQVELLLGSVLLVHRQVFSQVGLFDEQFFMYHEEVDLAYRAARMGFPLYYCPNAQAFHLGGHGTRDDPLRKYFWVRRNTLLFFRKHRPGPLRWSYWALTFAFSFLFNLARLRWDRAGAILRAVRQGLFRRPSS